MMLLEEPDASSRRLCLDCVRESFLRAEIDATGEQGQCYYCEREGKTFTISQMADRIEAAFEQHYERTPDQPEVSYESASWYRDGEPVIDAIAGAAEIDESPAGDIAAVLEDRNYDHELAKMGEECPFDSKAHYQEKPIDDFHYQAEWVAFENGIRERARYFSRAAQNTLESVFHELENLKTDTGKSVLVTAGPECETKHFFRARVFQSDETLQRALERPESGIGPPPPRFAAAGRMNAYGIAVFYGASDAKAALAEVRPPVGSRVVVGCFVITREIRVLDLAAMRDVFIKGSIFDASYILRLERAIFLSSLSRRMTRPVMPTDESFDYLPTQAIADYLATERRLDGIIYPSAQAEGEHTNVVLFHDASRVEPADLPKGTDVTVSVQSADVEDLAVEYTVWEEVPLPGGKAPESADVIPVLDLYEVDEILAGNDPRRSTLRLDVRSIEVHRIDSVSVNTTAFHVKRYRMQQSR